MNKIRVQHNTNYTAIFLKEITREAFTIAVKEKKKWNKLNQGVVIKPTKHAFHQFINLHSLTWKDVKENGLKQIELLGTAFSIRWKKNPPYESYPYVTYINKRTGKKETFGVLQGNTVADSLLETCFTNYTDEFLF